MCSARASRGMEWAGAVAESRNILKPDRRLCVYTGGVEGVSCLPLSK
jgi:hypothetical protein